MRIEEEGSSQQNMCVQYAKEKEFLASESATDRGEDA